MRMSLLITALLLSALSVRSSAQTAIAPEAGRDWITWGFDQERSGWNRGERTLTPQNVRGLRLKWNVQVSTAPKDVVLSTLTTPLVVEGVATVDGRKDMVFVQGSDGSVFALDADTGKNLWQKTYPSSIAPQRTADINCANAVQATPTIDKARGLIFFTTSDGKLHALALATGEERMAPIDMVAPYSRSWSLNLIDNVVYVASARGCGNGRPVEWGSVSAMDVTDLAHPQLSRTYTSKGRPAGPWGRGGAVKGPKGVYVQTSDGPNDPGAGIFGNAIVAILPKAYGIADSFIASNWKYLNGRDLDFGSGGPVVFPHGKRSLLAAGGKEAVVYLLDANNLAGPSPGNTTAGNTGISDHARPLYQSPRLGNDEQTYSGLGIWGGLSTYVSDKGERWLYVPMWGPPAQQGPSFKIRNGEAPHGSVMAFRVVGDDAVSLDPAWISRDLFLPDSVAVANGVVYAVQTAEQAIQHPDNPEGHGRAIPGKHQLTLEELARFRSTPVTTMTLFALDAETGKQLYSSGKVLSSFTHFTQPVVALGKVFLVDHDSHVYAFGLK